MSLQNFQYDIIMREYNRRQTQVMHDLEKRRSCAFAKAPRLAEIDREVASLSAQKARSLPEGYRQELRTGNPLPFGERFLSARYQRQFHRRFLLFFLL